MELLVKKDESGAWTCKVYGKEGMWVPGSQGTFDNELANAGGLVRVCWKCGRVLETIGTVVRRGNGLTEAISNQGYFVGCSQCEAGVVRVLRNTAMYGEGRYLFFASPGYRQLQMTTAAEVCRTGRWVFCRLTEPLSFADELQQANGDAKLSGLLDIRYQGSTTVRTILANVAGRLVEKCAGVAREKIQYVVPWRTDVTEVWQHEGRMLFVLPVKMLVRGVEYYGVTGSDAYRMWWRGLYNVQFDSPQLHEMVTGLIAQGFFAPLVKPPVDYGKEADGLLATMGQAKGLTLEGVKRLYARL